MYQQTYFVDKQTGTFADVCSAYGLAAILDLVLQGVRDVRDSRIVRLVDQGATYAIQLNHALKEEWIENAKFIAPIDYIKTKTPKVVSAMPEGIKYVDYEEQKEVYNTYRDARQNLRHTMNRGVDESDTTLPSKPSPYYPVWQKINTMSGISTYDSAVINWFVNRENAADVIKLLLALHAETPNPISACEKKWKILKKDKNLVGDDRLTMLQVFNPSTGKGGIAPKADKLEMKSQKKFWLCEYVKMVGFYHCAVPRYVLVKQGVPPKDRKTFALAPVNITLEEHNTIFAKFRDEVGNRHAIKSDIFASLRYMDCFLQHCEAEASASLAVQLLGRAPENFVAGLYTAFYKDLGNSSAVMNLSFINLPRWMNVNDSDDVRLYQQMIAEHLKIVGSLEEERSEGYQLLQHYRDFLSANDIMAFFDFTAKYPNYLLDALAESHFWVKPLSTTNLRRLLMNTEERLTPIIESEGFQNIARAIRQSTVRLQYQTIFAKKQKKPKPPYDVRYGLGEKLRRKANYPREFIQELSDFLHTFNAENVRAEENADAVELSEHYRRKSVREDDITEIVRLIDRYGPQTVCHLLVAFGYALTSRDAAPADDVTSNTQQGDQNER